MSGTGRVLCGPRSGIGFLGYGKMVQAPTQVPRLVSCTVSAWTRTPKPEAGLPVFHESDQLEPFFNQTDIAVCLLPLTTETEGIFCARTVP